MLGAMNPGARAERMRVLLADDCRHARLLVTGLLLKWGIVPTPVCKGEHAVQLVQRQGFDVVIMNFLMPDVDGVVATARIRQFERENARGTPVPIVAYSALDLDSMSVQLQRLGVTAVLSRPCCSASLRSCLDFCADARHSGT